MPTLIIIAGANGVGKTTLATPYAEEIGYQFLNADNIAKSLTDRGATNAMIKAGRIFFTRLNAALKQRENLVVETTLSGSYIENVVKRAQSAGYLVELIYIFVDSPDVSVERVHGRVSKGGHHVPEVDIRRRFGRSLAIFWDVLRPMTNSVRLYYNGLDGYQLILTKIHHEHEILHDLLYRKFLDLLNDYA